jgi:hypothetical protein
LNQYYSEQSAHIVTKISNRQTFFCFWINLGNIHGQTMPMVTKKSNFVC